MASEIKFCSFSLQQRLSKLNSALFLSIPKLNSMHFHFRLRNLILPKHSEIEFYAFGYEIQFWPSSTKLNFMLPNFNQTHYPCRNSLHLKELNPMTLTKRSFTSQAVFLEMAVIKKRKEIEFDPPSSPGQLRTKFIYNPNGTNLIHGIRNWILPILTYGIWNCLASSTSA